MTESTSGICLHYYKYSDSSVVAKIFTEGFGLRSFVLKGVRGKKSKNKINLLQSLNIIQLEFTNNNKRQLQYVKEINKSDKFPLNILDMNKRFIALFISEILLKVLVDSEKSDSIYVFILETIYMIHQKGNLSKNFSILFLIKLSTYLGFCPNSEHYERKYFNLETGEFSNQLSYYCLSGKNKEYLALLLNNNEVDIPYKNRKELLKYLQKYYSLHHYNIDNLKSYDIIESLRT